MEGIHYILKLAEILMADTTPGQAWSHHFNDKKMWIELWLGMTDVDVQSEQACRVFVALL